MSEEWNEYQIQREMARSLETVNIRLWGQWNGDFTRPRWRCNKHLNHEFRDTVDTVAEREKELGTGCPFCAALLERPVVSFEEFKVSAVAVNKARKKSMERATAKARRASFNRMQAS